MSETPSTVDKLTHVSSCHITKCIALDPHIVLLRLKNESKAIASR
jgi:hypothetical protein